MSGNVMVEQVNKLIGNLLAGVGEVFLPDVGSLYVERQRAQRLSGGMILPPLRRVAFTSQQRGESLVSAIARSAQCEGMQAQDIYNRWLARTKVDETLTLEGVGVLKYKHFTLDEAFDKRLNPYGHVPVKVKARRHFDWVIWTGIVAVGIAVVGLALLLEMKPQLDMPGASPTNVEAFRTQIPDPAAAEVALESIPFDAAQQQDTASAVQHPVAPVAEMQTAETETLASQSPSRLVSGRKYVVLGVFSTLENAERAVDAATKKEPALRGTVYIFGDKFMVSPFESPDAEACAQFMRNYSGSFQGLWVYTAR